MKTMSASERRTRTEWEKANSLPTNTDRLEHFFCSSGVFSQTLTSLQVADDLTDVIEVLRSRKEYAESDRLRTLQNRLRESSSQLAWLVGADPVPAA